VWKALADHDGPVLRYVPELREGTPIADLATVIPHRSSGDAAAAALAQLPGWLLATGDLALANRLIKMGAKPRRHAIVMQCDLRGELNLVDIDPRFTLRSLPDTADPRLWAPLLPSWRAAFPPDHPDHFDGDDPLAIAFLRRLIDGSELGPLHRSTTVLLDGSGTPVAGIMVNIRSQDPPLGGAWIADIWRDPALRGTGVGAMLISHAKRLLVEDGHACLGLAVTAGNPARATYHAQGFRTVTESQTVLLPERTLPRGAVSPS
jgi:ribosomal protein S18 acetylase RimI-like enzyme